MGSYTEKERGVGTQRTFRAKMVAESGMKEGGTINGLHSLMTSTSTQKKVRIWEGESVGGEP